MPHRLPLVSPHRAVRGARAGLRPRLVQPRRPAGFFETAAGGNPARAAASNWNSPGCACISSADWSPKMSASATPQAPDNPALSLAEVQLQLNYRALLHRRWQIDGLVLRQGQFVWPLSPTNALTLDNIQTDLRFQANDTWSLDHFQADFAGVKLVAVRRHRPRAGNPQLGNFSRQKDRPIAPPGRRSCENFPTRSTRFISPARRN